MFEVFLSEEGCDVQATLTSQGMTGVSTHTTPLAPGGFAQQALSHSHSHGHGHRTACSGLITTCSPLCLGNF